MGMKGDTPIPMPTDLPLHERAADPQVISHPGSKIATSTRRWATVEFFLYYAIAIVVIPVMTWIPVSLSSPTHPNSYVYRAKLSNGWILGRDIDNSDPQYRNFRNHLPALTLSAAIYFASKYIYTRLSWGKGDAGNKLFLIPYLVTFSMLMLVGLHGTSALKILLILCLNYAIAVFSKGSTSGPMLTWVFNILTLFANERNAGYRFATLHPALGTLDLYQGLYPRWDVCFNITMLRLVSFNMDYHWAWNRQGVTGVDGSYHQHWDAVPHFFYRGKAGEALSEKQRKALAHPLEMYSFINYLAYVLYPPLYIAGPIITFNDFMWQLRRPLGIHLRSLFLYFVRFLICLLTMELVLHFMYVVAIKDTRAWTGDTPAQLSMIGFWNLVIIWLKLLLPWRFFRLWALADGIDPPENMIRCVTNNYSTMGFWRSWHRSYNLWIVRYIYIPLGGTKHVFLNSVLIFTFVALWHDLTFKMLTWGWLISIFILPELCATYAFPASKFGNQPWYRHLCAAGAVINLFMMMIANLVGFVIGTDGVSYFIHQLLGTMQGLHFLVIACICVFAAVQLMFEYREEEMRHGIYRRC